MQQLLVVFPPSPEISPTSQGGFLTLEITFLSLTPTPSPAFLPGFSGRFHSPAQSFSGLSTDGKVYGEVTLNMSEGSQPFIHTLPQQLLMSTLLQVCHLGSCPCRCSASATFSHKVGSHCLGPQTP